MSAAQADDVLVYLTRTPEKKGGSTVELGVDAFGKTWVLHYTEPVTLSEEERQRKAMVKTIELMTETLRRNRG